MKERKLILYISMSLDGYIAGKNDDLSFLSAVEQEGEDYGYGDFVQRVDTVLIGRKTYEKVKAMGYDYPHTDKDVFIISKTMQGKDGSFHYYGGDLNELIGRLKAKAGKHIYCDGGAQLANDLLKLNLIDEIILSVIPVMLGEGISLFDQGNPGSKLRLLSSRAFETGMVQMHYEVIK